MRWLYALHDTEPNRYRPQIVVAGDADYYNERGYGIFFTVNTFKTKERKESNLEKLDHWYVDIDSGTKTNQFKKIVEFGLVPSMVVETKNGHHVYWAIKDSPTLEEYKSILIKLIAFFNADKNAKDAARLLRMPGYYHMKNPDSKFLVECIFQRDISYTSDEINDCLPEIPTHKIVEKKSVEILVADDFWINASNLNCVDALSRLSGVPELGDDKFTLRHSTRGKFVIYSNDKPTSCWIDEKGFIGSSNGGGPTIIQWIGWYYNHDKAKVADIIKKYFPETIPDLNFKIT